MAISFRPINLATHTPTPHAITPARTSAPFAANPYQAMPATPQAQSASGFAIARRAIARLGALSPLLLTQMGFHSGTGSMSGGSGSPTMVFLTGIAGVLAAAGFLYYDQRSPAEHAPNISQIGATLRASRRMPWHEAVGFAKAPAPARNTFNLDAIGEHMIASGLELASRSFRRQWQRSQELYKTTLAVLPPEPFTDHARVPPGAELSKTMDALAQTAHLAGNKGNLFHVQLAEQSATLMSYGALSPRTFLRGKRAPYSADTFLRQAATIAELNSRSQALPELGQAYLLRRAGQAQLKRFTLACAEYMEAHCRDEGPTLFTARLKHMAALQLAQQHFMGAHAHLERSLDTDVLLLKGALAELVDYGSSRDALIRDRWALERDIAETGSLIAVQRLRQEMKYRRDIG